MDALLAKFKLDEAARNTTQVQQSSAPPSARLFASMTAISPQVRVWPSSVLSAVQGWEAAPGVPRDDQRVCWIKQPLLAAFMTSLAHDMQEFLLYGGEWYDGKQDKMRVFGDAFVYNLQQQSWKHILIPNRCIHCFASASCMLSLTVG